MEKKITNSIIRENVLKLWRSPFYICSTAKEIRGLICYKDIPVQKIVK